MKLYDHYPDCEHHHSKTVADHCIWVLRILQLWTEKGSEWTDPVDPREYTNLLLAGYLHDVGKTGDLTFNGTFKKFHPRVGFEYLIGKRWYNFTTGPEKLIIGEFHASEEQPFHGIQKSCLSAEDHKIVAVTVAASHLFGDILMIPPGKWTNYNIPEGAKKYIMLPDLKYILFVYIIISYMIECGLSVTQNSVYRQVTLALAVGAADVFGAHTVVYHRTSNHLPISEHSTEGFCKKGVRPYYKYQFDTRGVEEKNRLLRSFKRVKYDMSFYGEWKNKFNEPL